MKPVLSLLFLLHFTFYTLHFSYSQSPGWVNYESRLQQYPFHGSTKGKLPASLPTTSRPLRWIRSLPLMNRHPKALSLNSGQTKETDGSRVLLLDSWYVDEDKINKPYQLPQAFRCAEPFGAELLQMVAQTEQFRPLAVKSESGHDFISDSDKQIMIATRGMKKEKPALLIAEKRMNITTIEK
jgi:hypothetical protein